GGVFLLPFGGDTLGAKYYLKNRPVFFWWVFAQKTPKNPNGSCSRRGEKFTESLGEESLSYTYRLVRACFA
ncbi:hypothetical protein FHS90_001745, partial [Rufibacter quisquiliarum]|nr:hypothetical protein [Rufibacter quisquiliarum]